MPWLCSHLVPGLIMKGPLPMGASLYAWLSNAPATSGIGAKAVSTVRLSNSQSPALRFTTSVWGSGADSPEKVVAEPLWSSLYPATPDR